MNKADYIKELEEGCYHEIGHIIAAIEYSLDDERLKGISFSREDSFHPYKFNTDYDFDTWKFPEQLQAFTMLQVCGGIFQQMKSTYSNLCNGINKYNIYEKCLNHFSKEKALITYFTRLVKPSISGMEIDLSRLNNWCSDALKYNWIKKMPDLETAKKDAILLLMPYVKNENINKLANTIAEIIWQKKNKEDKIFIDINTIKKYIDKSQPTSK